MKWVLAFYYTVIQSLTQGEISALMVTAVVLPLAYALSTGCPVKWTIQQERALAKDVKIEHAVGAATHAKQTYLRFLWLPEVRDVRKVKAQLVHAVWKVSTEQNTETHAQTSITRFMSIVDYLTIGGAYSSFCPDVPAPRPLDNTPLVVCTIAVRPDWEQGLIGWHNGAHELHHEYPALRHRVSAR